MPGARVCFVLPSAYGYFNDDADVVGGGARQLSLISRELTDSFDVHFVVGNYGQAKRETHDGVTVHRSYTPSPNTPRWRKPGQLLELAAAMRRADADVYVYRGRPYLATVTYGITLALRARWVYNLANDPNIDGQPESLPRPLRHLFNYALDDSDSIVTQTPAQAKRLRKKYGHESTVIPSGYPPADSILPHSDREWFLWVGRLDGDQKQPHLLLDVAELAPEATFEIVGPGGQDPEYNERIRERIRGLENVTYHGQVSPVGIHAYYRRAKALVNTSRYEGFPSTFLEAWRYDTPVLSLEISPSRYAEREADVGFARGQTVKLAELVDLLDGDPEMVEEFSRPTFEYFREHLTIDEVASRYGDLLDAVCRGSSGPQR